MGGDIHELPILAASQGREPMDDVCPTLGRPLPIDGHEGSDEDFANAGAGPRVEDTPWLASFEPGSEATDSDDALLCTLLGRCGSSACVGQGSALLSRPALFRKGVRNVYKGRTVRDSSNEKHRIPGALHI